MRPARSVNLSLIALALVSVVATARPASAQRSRMAPDDGYLDHAGLLAEARSLAASSSCCAVETIETSREGRDIILLTLSADPKLAAERPAFLITAGLDGAHRVGAETALRVAKEFAQDHAALLDEVTVYVIPCANPDGAERFRLGPRGALAGVIRPVDDDRDGAIDEDPPVDLDGNGLITQMRRIDPPLEVTPTHLADPVEPRLLCAPDPLEGERAVYTVHVEGLDADGDGLVAEDGAGEVDLDRNFMHLWPEHVNGSGPYPLSEKESLALARFVIEHENIVAAVTYGRHDNLVNPPDGKGRTPSGEPPLEIDPEDVGLYKAISKLFTEATAQKRAPIDDNAGSFHVWLSAQRGIPSLATVVWGRPDATEVAEEAPDGDAMDEAQPDQGAPDTPADSTSEEPSDAPAPGGWWSTALEATRLAEKTAPADEEKKPAEAKARDEEAAGWLAYSDRDRGGAGFVDWMPFDHPTLGRVEIGGFVPGFTANPPEELLDALAEGETKFLLALIERRPRLVVEGPVVAALADGLYEIRVAIVNEGFLPTRTALARRARTTLPTIVRLSTPIERIVAGQRTNRSWGLEGSGGRMALRSIVREAPGATVEIEIVHRQMPARRIELSLGEGGER